MRDQVTKYSESGLACAFVGEEQTDENVKEAVMRGHFQPRIIAMCTSLAGHVSVKYIPEQPGGCSCR